MGNQWGRKATTYERSEQPYDATGFSVSLSLTNAASAKRDQYYKALTPEERAKFLQSAYDRMSSEGETLIRHRCVHQKRWKMGLENLKGNDAKMQIIKNFHFL